MKSMSPKSGHGVGGGGGGGMAASASAGDNGDSVVVRGRGGRLGRDSAGAGDTCDTSSVTSSSFSFAKGSPVVARRAEAVAASAAVAARQQMTLNLSQVV